MLLKLALNKCALLKNTNSKELIKNEHYTEIKISSIADIITPDYAYQQLFSVT